MRRRLLNLLTAGSLLLCVAVCVLWVRSYFVWEMAALDTHARDDEYTTRTRWSLGSVYGRLSLKVKAIRDRVALASAPGEVGGARWRYAGNAAGTMGIFGWWETHRLFVVFEDEIDPGGHAESRRYVFVPYWALVLLFAIAPIGMAWKRRRRGRRHSAGLCPACGYDLRATPDRCPECGAAVRMQQPIPFSRGLKSRASTAPAKVR
jgi:hypothetical protein